MNIYRSVQTKTGHWVVGWWIDAIWQGTVWGTSGNEAEAAFDALTMTLMEKKDAGRQD